MSLSTTSPYVDTSVKDRVCTREVMIYTANNVEAISAVSASMYLATSKALGNVVTEGISLLRTVADRSNEGTKVDKYSLVRYNTLVKYYNKVASRFYSNYVDTNTWLLKVSIELDTGPVSSVKGVHLLDGDTVPANSVDYYSPPPILRNLTIEDPLGIVLHIQEEGTDIVNDKLFNTLSIVLIGRQSYPSTMSIATEQLTRSDVLHLESIKGICDKYGHIRLYNKIVTKGMSEAFENRSLYNDLSDLINKVEMIP